jgi:N-acyl-D-amino-acid deacylase
MRIGLVLFTLMAATLDQLAPRYARGALSLSSLDWARDDPGLVEGSQGGPPRASREAAVAPAPQGIRGAGLLIRQGQLYDGTGAPPRTADVRVENDAIVEVAPSLSARGAERVLDAAGLAVAAGFIDSHSHAIAGLGDRPDAAAHVRQGITTAIVGQDGGGDLPIADVLDLVERVRPAINVATLVGHGTVRGLVLGADFRRAATPAEIEVMKALVDRGMRDGAFGLSSGLEYDPGFYARPDEVVALARVAASHGGYYTSHVRDEEKEVFAAWREAIAVGREAKLPVVISHAKVAAKPVWGRARDVLAILEDARRDGVRALADWYPYTYWQSSIYVLIPDRDYENRDQWRVGLDEVGGAGRVRVIDYRPDLSLNGRTLEEIAAARGTDVITTVVEMIRAAGPDIGIICESMIEPDLERLFAHPQVVIGSDGALAGRHPRGYGAFPRVLARYVRERRLVPLEEAIAKMTARTAAQIGLRDRGLVARGMKADLVVFDPATVADRGTPERPDLPPVGIRFVVVNGQVVLDGGEMTTARPGRALRREHVEGRVP